jgi:Tol biopolymer transport system component
MRADGTAQTRIATQLSGDKWVPQLSPSGTTIVFAYVDPAVGHPEVWSISATGGKARRLTTTPKAATGPTWSLHPHFSPDGRRIVYASTKSGSSQIWIMNADGSSQTQITSGFGADFPDANAPKWSPDGSIIAFWSGFETKYGDIWTMRADGTGARQLTDQPGTISSDNPAWSPDGTKLLFDTSRRGSAQIWMMNVDGSDQHLLVDIRVGNTTFSWQPLPR